MSELRHSAKGTKWKNHKYIEIRNGRYIYNVDTKTGKVSTKEITKESKKHDKVAKANAGKYRGAVNAKSEAGNKAVQSNRNLKQRRERLQRIETTKKFESHPNRKQSQANAVTKRVNKKGETQTKYTKKNKKPLWRQDDQKRITNANKKNAKTNRSGGSTNSQKLLANQRKKQRSLGSKVIARAKKLARALKRTIKYAPKNIASIPNRVVNRKRFDKLLAAGRSGSAARYQTAKGKAWKKARAAQKKFKLPSLKKKR